MSAEENKAIVRRYFEELWNQGDLAFIEECMGPDVTHAWGHETHESWKVAVSAWLTAFPDFQYHVDALVAEGATVAANTHFTATHRGIFHMRNWGTWPPTGKSIDFREMIFFHFADGKIVEHWEAWNSRAFEQLLGGEPPQATTTT
jgi:predicted ester cyclase